MVEQGSHLHFERRKFIILRQTLSLLSSCIIWLTFFFLSSNRIKYLNISKLCYLDFVFKSFHKEALKDSLSYFNNVSFRSISTCPKVKNLYLLNFVINAFCFFNILVFDKELRETIRMCSRYRRSCDQ